MMDRIKNVGLLMRTAYCLGRLRQDTGLSVGRLERRIRRNQYEKNGLTAPSPDSVRDYFLLRRCPAVDGTERGQPSWLFAAELEFRGVAYRFFHPVFDLLWEPIRSSPRWIARMGRIPQVWIDEAMAKGDSQQVQEWEAFNEAVRPKRGRPRTQAADDPLTLVHLALLRLPRDVSGQLFERKGLASTYARMYRPFNEEIPPLVARPGMDALAALVGLVREAALIGDGKRMQAAKQALREHVRLHGVDAALARVERRFLQLIDEQASVNNEARRYSTPEIIGSGFPVTWQSKIYRQFSEHDGRRGPEEASSQEVS